MAKTATPPDAVQAPSPVVDEVSGRYPGQVTRSDDTDRQEGQLHESVDQAARPGDHLAGGDLHGSDREQPSGEKGDQRRDQQAYGVWHGTGSGSDRGPAPVASRAPSHGRVDIYGLVSRSCICSRMESAMALMNFSMVLSSPGLN
jgi:hypothetical protein